MKKINLILISIITIFSIFLNSCETEVTGINLPYEETIIVYGLLCAGELSDGLYIAKTIPPLERPTIENSKITDAIISIKQNDKIINLVYDELLYYKTVEPLIPQAGDTLELTINWKGKEYKSQTYIPEKPKDTNVNYTYNFKKDQFGNGFYLNIKLNFLANSNDTYFAGRASNFGGDTNLYYNNAIQGSEILVKQYSNNLISGSLSDTTNFDVDDFIKESTTKFVFIEVLDNAFYNFYQSRYNGEDMSSVFGTSGLNVKGNISNNGLGIFIGRNRKFYKIENITRD